MSRRFDSGLRYQLYIMKATKMKIHSNDAVWINGKQFVSHDYIKRRLQYILENFDDISAWNSKHLVNKPKKRLNHKPIFEQLVKYKVVKLSKDHPSAQPQANGQSFLGYSSLARSARARGFGFSATDNGDYYTLYLI